MVLGPAVAPESRARSPHARTAAASNETDTDWKQRRRVRPALRAVPSSVHARSVRPSSTRSASAASTATHRTSGPSDCARCVEMAWFSRRSDRPAKSMRSRTTAGATVHPPVRNNAAIRTQEAPTTSRRIRDAPVDPSNGRPPMAVCSVRRSRSVSDARENVWCATPNVSRRRGRR